VNPQPQERAMRVHKIVYSRKPRNAQYRIALYAVATVAYRGATAGGELRAASFKG
jgi:hypothetical protein